MSKYDFDGYLEAKKSGRSTMARFSVREEPRLEVDPLTVGLDAVLRDVNPLRGQVVGAEEEFGVLLLRPEPGLSAELEADPLEVVRGGLDDFLATTVEPVKEIFLAPLWATRALPTSGPR
ncbi:hypothetical protein [Streptomyces sp. NPDC055681]